MKQYLNDAKLDTIKEIIFLNDSYSLCFIKIELLELLKWNREQKWWINESQEEYD